MKQNELLIIYPHNFSQLIIKWELTICPYDALTDHHLSPQLMEKERGKGAGVVWGTSNCIFLFL